MTTTTRQGTVARKSELQRGSSGCTADRHGTASAYQKRGCRCPAALRDKKLADYERATGRPRTVDSTGTVRRIRALQTIGWTGRQIMAAAGWPGASLGAQIYQQDRVYRATAQRFAAVYDKLSCTPGPSKYTRTYARNRGWLPPLAWDDDTIDDPDYDPSPSMIETRSPAPLFIENVPFIGQGQLWHYVGSDEQFTNDFINSTVDEIAVERYADGDTTITLNRAEKLAVYTLMLRRGVTRNEVCRRLKLSGTTAAKYDQFLAMAPASVGGRPDAEHVHDDIEEAAG